jgi:hypothetical protein
MTGFDADSRIRKYEKRRLEVLNSFAGKQGR